MVGKVCTVCKKCSYLNKKLSFFTYPGDPQRRIEWLKSVDRMDLVDKLENNKTRGNHRICERHFEKKYVKQSTVCEGRKFLSKDAFPTLCLENPAIIVPMTAENFLRPPVDLHSGNISKDSMSDDRSLDDTEMYSPQSCTDLAEFCESVIKVSKGTQTFIPDSLTIKRISESISEESAKRKKVEQVDSKTSFLQLCNQFLPEGMSQIIKWKLNDVGSDNFKLFALNMYYSGANSYEMLKNTLGLPTENVLKKFLIPRTTKLSDNFLDALKSKVNNMSDREKICSVSVGSVFLKPNLYYDIKFDRIIGFHDIDGEQTVRLAKYAIVIMIQGIVENWRQPIAYSFISEYDNFPEISTWIDEVITLLIDIGLDVRTFVSDPRSEFLYVSESRFVTAEKSFFTLNNRNIYYIYDSPQLLKVVRNNLKSCNFQYSSENFAEEDPAQFYNKLNNLCDLLNVNNRYSTSLYKRALCNEVEQINFMEHMMNLLQNLKLVRKVDGVDVTEHMTFIDSFQITINSVMMLLNDLNAIGIKYLLTNRLTHNCINRFFKRVKQSGNKEECTGRQFHRCFVRSFVYNMLRKPRGSIKYNLGSSVDTDKCSQQILNDAQSEEVENNFNKPLKVFVTDYRTGLPERNTFVYLCGYLYLKVIQHHKCNEFKTYLKCFKESRDKDDVPYLCSVSLNVKNCNILPPDNFTEYLMLLEKKFKQYFTPDLQINSVGQEIIREFENIEFEMPCQCFPLDYLKALFIRVRIYYIIRKNNRMFKKRKGAKAFKVFSLL